MLVVMVGDNSAVEVRKTCYGGDAACHCSLKVYKVVVV